MGYGSRALQALNAFYSGEYLNLDENPRMEQDYPDPTAIDPVSPLSLKVGLDSMKRVVLTQVYHLCSLQTFSQMHQQSVHQTLCPPSFND